jgi:hypothetical protein
MNHQKYKVCNCSTFGYENVFLFLTKLCYLRYIIFHTILFEYGEHNLSLFEERFMNKMLLNLEIK